MSDGTYAEISRHYIPSPDEIAKAKAEIQAGWNERAEYLHTVVHNPPAQIAESKYTPGTSRGGN